MTSSTLPGGNWPPLGATNSNVRHNAASDTSSVMSDADMEQFYFGDYLGEKQPNVFRGISCQLGGLPIDPEDPTHDTLIKSMLDYRIDVMAL